MKWDVDHRNVFAYKWQSKFYNLERSINQLIYCKYVNKTGMINISGQVKLINGGITLIICINGTYSPWT